MKNKLRLSKEEYFPIEWKVVSHDTKSGIYWLDVKWQAVGCDGKPIGLIQSGEYLESHVRMIRECPEYKGRVMKAISKFNDNGSEFIDAAGYVEGSGLSVGVNVCSDGNGKSLRFRSENGFCMLTSLFNVAEFSPEFVTEKFSSLFVESFHSFRELAPFTEKLGVHLAKQPELKTIEDVT